ncbi:UNVERIFIED_CONTAM: hypothetical protein FKN15_061398 [Acipenser sinensis]
MRLIQAFEVFQPNRVEANNSGVARLRCNYNFTGKGEEFRITLFRGISDQTIVCASSFHLPNTTFETKEGLFSCQGEASRNSVDLTISGMSSSDTDIYKCRVEIMYPPPYRQRVGNGTVIYIPAFQVTQPHLVAANSSGFAILTCDYKYSKEIVELKIYLLRARHNDTISCETSVNESKKGSLCLMEHYNNSVTLTISRLNVSDADLYVCRVEIRSPPPFVYAEGTGTIVYVAEGLNEVQHAVYRTAFKLRSLQKLCQLHFIDLPLIGPMLQDLRTKLCDDGAVSVQDLSQSLQLLFQHASQEKPGQVAEGATEHTVSLVATMFDRDQTGFIQLRSVAAALIAFSADKPSAKYTDLFQLAVQCSASHYATSRQVTRSGLRVLLQDLKQVPGVVCEGHVFGQVESAVRSCFHGVLSGGIPQEKFTAWLNSEPQFLLWLSTLYRVSATEAVTHQSRCDICKAFPITGLRVSATEAVTHQSRCDICKAFPITGLRYLEEQLQLWKVKVQSELNSQEDKCDKLEAKIEVLREHNKNLQDELVNVRQLVQVNLNRTKSILPNVSQSPKFNSRIMNEHTAVKTQRLGQTCSVRDLKNKERQPSSLTVDSRKPVKAPSSLSYPNKHETAGCNSFARYEEAEARISEKHQEILSETCSGDKAPVETRDVGVTKPIPNAEVLKNAQVDSTLSVPNEEKPCGDGIQDEEEELFQLVQRLKSALSVKVQPGLYSNVKQELIEAAGYVGDSLSHLVNKVALTTPY